MVSAAPAPPAGLSDSSDLALRPLARGDVDALIAYARDPEVVRWTAVPSPYQRRDAGDFLARCDAGWADGSLVSFAIVYQGSLVGVTDLRIGADRRAGEVGFGLTAPARGAHVMSRSLRLLAGYGFDVLGLELLHYRAAVGNWASRRVAWACGFRHEGTLRGALVQRGERVDAWHASLRPGETMAATSRWLEALPQSDGIVALRAWRREDALRVLQACADPLSQRWLIELPNPYTRADAEAYVAGRPEALAQGQMVCWCVTAAGGGDCLASMAVMMRGPGVAELGWWAHPEGRGRGVVTRAARLAARHAFDGLGLHRLLVRTAQGNDASAAVALRLGCTEVGRDREAEADRQGCYLDDRRFDLLAGELASSG